jgi:hypothetical protein
VPASPLFGVRPSDPAIVSVAAQIGVAALIACYMAGRADPMIVLREEEAIG